MSMIERLADDLTNTHLTGPPEESEHLLFKPQIGSGFSQKALDEIPRYLFRVVSPHSVGETNEMWVHSESASLNRRSSTEDIFFELNSEKGTTVARTLNLHLRWWPKDGIDDNFVSWTSSLLFAIQYIYYKHLSSKDGSGLSEIKLYAIDTKGFPEGTFLCDLDLINTFSEFDDHPPGKDLQNLRNLRNETEYYFGEYLSQGSLRIEGKCEVISAQCLFENNRLRRLQPHFREFQHLPINNGRPEWPREVNRLRDAIWRPTNLWVPSLAEVADRLGAVREIVQNLKPRWRLPLAIYFASLIGPVSFIGEIGVEPQDIFFKNLHSTLPDGQRALHPYSLKIVSAETMLEMKQVKNLVYEIYKYHTLKNALDLVETAETSMRGLHFDNLFSENGLAFASDDQNQLLDRQGRYLLKRLRSVQRLCEKAISAIS